MSAGRSVVYLVLTRVVAGMGGGEGDRGLSFSDISGKSVGQTGGVLWDLGITARTM